MPRGLPVFIVQPVVLERSLSLIDLCLYPALRLRLPGWPRSERSMQR